MSKKLYRRGVVGALALLLDAVVERLPSRWSPAAQSVAGLALARLPGRLPGNLGLWAEAGLLSTALDMRSLSEHKEIAGQEEAKVAQALVALADGANDEVVTPLCYYLVGGLPGAMLYRLLVSLQSDLGPQGAALVCWLRAVPSYVTGALLVAAAHLRREDAKQACRRWRSAEQALEDPAHSRPRAALTGALGIEPEERPPTPEDVSRGYALVRTAIALGAALMLAVPLMGRLHKRR